MPKPRKLPAISPQEQEIIHPLPAGESAIVVSSMQEESIAHTQKERLMTPRTANQNTETLQLDPGMIDEALGDLDLSEHEDTPLIEEIVINEDVDAALDTIEAKEEAYKAQIVEEKAAAEAAPAKKAKAPRAPKTAVAAKPKIVRDLAALPDELFALETGETADKAAVLALQPKQKKVAEKFENLFISLNAGRLPSTYVVDAFKALKGSSTGSISNAGLVETLKASGYSQGTSASQAGQVMILFDLLGIAKRTGQSLTLNPNSVIAERLINLGA